MPNRAPIVRDLSRWARLWRPFWAIPATLAAGSVLLGLALPLMDRWLADHLPFVFQGGADGARSVLSTVATAMISVTGLVFSITMVVLQLASSQFSPRVLSTFLERRIVQITLGVFAGSFLYALTVLRSVKGNSSSRDEFVPQTSVTLAYLYVVASVLLFVAFIHQITTAVQVSVAIFDIGERTRQCIEMIAPDSDEDVPTGHSDKGYPASKRTDLLLDDRHGHIVGINAVALVEWAQEHEAYVELTVSLGDFLVPEQRLGFVHSSRDIDGSDFKHIVRTIRTAAQRTLDSDLGFGLRQLVDIAERALSPGINDPTTAEQAINEAHVVLHLLAQRPMPQDTWYDDEDRLRGSYRTQSFNSELPWSVREIAYYGKDSVRIIPLVKQILDSLAEVARPEYACTIEDAKSIVEQSQQS